MRTIVTFLFILMLFCVPTRAAVIFQDNFDSQTDWTRTQPTDQSYTCFPNSSCSLPTGWNAIYDGFTYLTGSYNNLYVNTNAGYPRTADDIPCYGGSGKCLTQHDESDAECVHDCSDGNLGVYFPSSYNDIYMRFYMAWQVNYQWASGIGMKFWHVQNWDGPGDSPWHYHTANYANTQIFGIGGLIEYSGSLYYMTAYSCEGSISCATRPDDGFDPENNADYKLLGTISNLRSSGFLDGNWHRWEAHYKVGTPGGNDGRHRLWLDGVLIYDSNTHVPNEGGPTPIPFLPAGSTSGRQWNMIALGGNQNNYLGSEVEQWRAYDNLCIADTGPIGDTVCGAEAPTSSSFSGGTLSGGKIQ